MYFHLYSIWIQREDGGRKEFRGSYVTNPHDAGEMLKEWQGYKLEALPVSNLAFGFTLTAPRAWLKHKADQRQLLLDLLVPVCRHPPRAWRGKWMPHQMELPLGGP